MLKFTTLYLLISLILIDVSFAQSQNYKPTDPSINGRILEEEYKDGIKFEKFYSFIPTAGMTNMDSTIVYVKQTEDAIYFAFRYWPKGKVISKSLTRDRSTDEENEFFILLDLENKHQNGYFFAFSFMDNQRDQIIYNQRNMSSEWDWKWENKTTVFKEPTDTEPGYIETEIKIPVDKIQNKNTKQIGFDIQMFAYKPDGNSYWYSPIPNSELLSLKNTYVMDLKVPFKETLNLNINAMPFVVGDKFNDSSYGATFGGDFNVSLDRHTFKGTINTDESTLEADPFAFSFYNRPIFLQEKRPFFSKDLDIYRSTMDLFYTRAIENIELGGNYTYRSNQMKLGSIFVQEEPDGQGNRDQFFVLRPRYDYADGNIGGFFIYSKEKSLNDQQRVMSFDGSYRFPTNPLRFFGQFATNFDGNAYKAGGYYQFNNQGGFYADWNYTRVDENFRAPTYFSYQLQDPYDYQEIFLSGGHNFVYDRAWFPDFNFNVGYYKLNRLSDAFVYQDRINSNFSFRINDMVNMTNYVEYNRPDDYNEQGELIKRTNINHEVFVNVLLGSNSVNFGYYYGPYFGSYIKNPYANCNFIFFDRLGFRGSVSYVDFFDIKQTIWNLRLDYRVMDKLFLRGFFGKNTYTKDALLNTMVQYEFFAGSNAYFVFNLEGENLEYTRRYFKIGYEFSF